MFTNFKNKIMKNFILSLLAVIIVTATASAQSEGTYKSMKSTTTGLALDTVTNAGVREQVLRVPGVNNIITIVGTVTKISGTLGGSVKLLGSLNGTNYVQIDATAYTVTDIASQSFTWKVIPSAYTYYKVNYTGVTGPMAAKLATGLLNR